MNIAAPVAPLAERLRPDRLDDFFGQAHLLAPGRTLRTLIEHDQLHSMILWGPPGSGKTTLARLIAHRCDVHFIALSAVFAGVKDIRAAVDEARAQPEGRRTILFVDEVHRFNKAQQDGFLPYVENGTFMFIGATTENPSFELNKALLSRARVYILQRLEPHELRQVLARALVDTRAFPDGAPAIPDTWLDRISLAADGDARRALNLLEILTDLLPGHQAVPGEAPDVSILEQVLAGGTRRFDKHGEDFYDQISALHKSVRGSNPDAALYWLVRMLDGGCEPLYIARRVVRMASEDIGNADPRALGLALDAWDVLERLGSPEGELTLAQVVLYLAVAPKSNAAYAAYAAARNAVHSSGSLEVPLHLRNAPTALMKDAGYGRRYRYAHDEPEAHAAGEQYLPEALVGQRYYFPVNRGLEQRIAERLADLRERDRCAQGARSGDTLPARETT